MRLGLVARADDRGIGVQTWEFGQAMHPDRVLVVREPGAERRGFPAHLHRYPGATVVEFDPTNGTLPEAQVREFLEGLDVVYTVETGYDERLWGWAREAGCATVVHVNPEFWKWQEADDGPSTWWLPTSWRQGVVAPGARLVPVPCPTPPYEPDLQVPTPVRFLHTAGHRAAADRNGTTMVLQALRFLQVPAVWRLETQDRKLPSIAKSAQVRMARNIGGRPDRWAMYVDRDVMVLPRRYGGLCLPALEALAAGLVLVMTDVAPQSSTWPIVGVPATYEDVLPTMGGNLPLAVCDPGVLRRALDDLAAHPDQVAERRAESLAWARANDWPSLRPLYVEELQRAAAG